MITRWWIEFEGHLRSFAVFYFALIEIFENSIKKIFVMMLSLKVVTKYSETSVKVIPLK